MGELTNDPLAKLKTWIVDLGLERAGASIIAAARATVHLIPVEPDSYQRVGNSRFGGVPDLPEGVSWPTTRDAYLLRGGTPEQWDEDYFEEDDLYLGFLAQINLRELPRPAADPLPCDGWLYFFLGSDEEEMSDLTHLVLWYHGSEASLRRTAHPDPARSVGLSFQECPDFTPYQVTAEPGISLPRYGTQAFAALGLDAPGEPDLTDAYFKLQEAVASRNVGRRGGESQLLGYPFWTAEPSPALREQTLLFQIDSDPRIGMRWWDAGLVHFLISPDDLERGRFEKTYAGIYAS